MRLPHTILLSVGILVAGCASQSEEWSDASDQAMTDEVSTEPARIRGLLKTGSKPVPTAQVTLTCGSQVSAGQSSPRGLYRLSIGNSGSCVLDVDGKSAEVLLVAGEEKTYDFDVPMSGKVLRAP